MKTYSKKKLIDDILPDCVCEHECCVGGPNDWHFNSACQECKYKHRTDCHILYLLEKLEEYDLIKVRKTKIKPEEAED